MDDNNDIKEQEPEDGSAAEPENEDKSLEMSDELLAALAEAEDSLARPEKDEGEDEEEVELDLDEDLEEDEPCLEDSDPEKEEEEQFDINAVDEVEEEAPAPPSPREMELKLQIVNLRHQLRDKEKEIEQRVKELKQNAEQAKHIQRQFDGYKARTQKEKADWFNYGHEPVFKELLPAIDNLERAIAHSGDDADSGAVREGVQMTLRQLLAALKKFEVEPVESLGKEFDPGVHQAMAQVERPEAAPNTVIEEHQKAYLMKDRLLRAAMVVVSKKPAAEAVPAAEGGGAGDEDEG